MRITLATTLAFGLAFAGASVALVHTVRHSLEARQHAEATRALRSARCRSSQAGTDPEQLEDGPIGARLLADHRARRTSARRQRRRQPAHRCAPSGPTSRTYGAADGTVLRRGLAARSPCRRARCRSPSRRRSPRCAAASTRSHDRSGSARPASSSSSGLVAWVLVGRALRPVEAIRAQVDEITATTMHRRVPVPNTDDEVARLARTMNGMLDRLERASARQRAVRVRRFARASQSRSARSAPSSKSRRPTPTTPTGPRSRSARSARPIVSAASSTTCSRWLGSTKRKGRRSGPRSTSTTSCSKRARGTHRVPVRTRRGERGPGRGRRAPAHAGRAQPRRQRAAPRGDAGGDHAAPRRRRVGPRGRRRRPRHPRAEREHVFDRFTRLDEARGRADGGAGLGLAVVRRVGRAPRRHRLGGDSALGGARFVVRLPAI